MASTLNDVVQEARESWMKIDGVVAVAKGKKDQTDCIDVFIAINSDAIKEQIPKEFKNVPVVFREGGGPFVPSQ